MYYKTQCTILMRAGSKEEFLDELSLMLKEYFYANRETEESDEAHGPVFRHGPVEEADEEEYETSLFGEPLK